MHEGGRVEDLLKLEYWHMLRTEQVQSWILVYWKSRTEDNAIGKYKTNLSELPKKFLNILE